jgi:phosphoribosylaminoimidazole-succinocarboxamide synthase
VGDHDENISFEQLAARSVRRAPPKCATPPSALYRAASAYALTRGIVIADTKFEFGLDEAGR